MTDQAEQLAPVVQRNIKTLFDRRREDEEARAAHYRLADGISAGIGSMRFVVVQLVLVVAWVLANRGLDFDRHYVGLCTVAAVESIFLTAFVLISQNRMRALANERAELDVQVTLLAEHEITQIMRVLDAVAEKVGVPADIREDTEELIEEVEPEQVLEEISRRDD
ncbi:MAG TPA: DUF1003 domain-containing protein [Sporichthyaceae bacterium]|jgi:uncharacterized membrane protein